MQKGVYMKAMDRIYNIVGDGFLKRLFWFTSPVFYLALIGAIIYILIMVLLLLARIIKVEDLP
jgi:hypothetical protein